MAFKRRRSRILDLANARISSLKNIDPNMDLGGGLTITALDDMSGNLKSKLDDYNDKLALADASRYNLAQAEQEMRDVAERIFTGVATLYGRDSTEYEMVGGVRKSEIKSRVQPVTFVSDTTNETTQNTGS